MKTSAYVLLNFTLALFSGCESMTKNVTLTQATTLNNFPSGSAIAFFENRLYIAGDDASEIVVLDTDFGEMERIRLFEGTSGERIPKPVKADLESSAVMGNQIWFFGSGSLSPHRDSVFAFAPHDGTISRITFDNFYKDLDQQLIEPNIEAAARIGENLLFGARGNSAHPTNHLLLVSPTDGAIIKKITVQLPQEGPGISGLDYDPEADRLFISFSSEATASSYDDGKIGNSFLVWIDEATPALRKEKLAINGLIDLSELGTELNSQKIEGIAFVQQRSEIILVSDDDQGGTRLFRIKLD